MQIVENRALQLRLKQPSRVTNAISKSKATDAHTVLVHWGLDEVQKLQAMGIAAPSPIIGKYDWPGRFKPMDHQKKTASFLTIHKRCFCFNEQGCVDSDTEYLSPTGWVRISDYAGGAVAQYHPQNGSIEFVEPEEYVKLPCPDMIRVKTKYGVDQLLSPEHRVLIEDGKSRRGKQETIRADTLAARHDAYHQGRRTPVGGTRSGTENIAFSAATIPVTFAHAPDTQMPYTDAELRVLVAAIADGYFPSNTARCVVRLKKDRKKSRLRALLEHATIEYTERPCLPDGFTSFTFHSPERWKEFGVDFWAASASQLSVIRDEVLHWDGCTTRGARFSTTSKASADFIQFAFASGEPHDGGGAARVSEWPRKGRTEYTVQIRRGTKRLYLRGSGPTVRPEPSTDGFKYCFQVPSTYLLFRRNGCIFASGNTGKTASAIWAADYLMKLGLVHRVLIVCPVSIMDSAWRGDLFSFAMHRTADTAYGTPKKRKAVIASGAEFVVTNYEGVAIAQDEIAAGGFDLIIVDEATHYKNVRTKRWKALNKLLATNPRLWLMTGTPAAQSPVDAHGLARLVNPGGVPNRVDLFRDRVMWQKTKFKWLPKDDAVDTVHEVLQPAIRFEKEQCMDLPDMLYTRRVVEMTPQQKKYYKKMKADLRLEAADTTVSAPNAAIVMNKLLQVSAGAMYDDDGGALEFDISSRYSVLRETIDESSKKVLVFMPFRSIIAILREKLEADGVSTGVIHGGVSVGDRTEVFRRFQSGAEPRVLLIQPQAAAHGVTLTAANTVVWWSPTASLETYAQANARVHRKGQDSKCTVVQLSGSAMEKRLYDMLEARIDIHSQILDLYRGMLD